MWWNQNHHRLLVKINGQTVIPFRRFCSTSCPSALNNMPRSDYASAFKILVLLNDYERFSMESEQSDKENQGIVSEEDGNIVYDLRSLDLKDLSAFQIRVASYPSNHLPRPLQGSTCMGVTHLLLDYNDIEELPNEIGDLRCLKKLSLMGNQLCCFPEGIGNLTELETLNVNENFLQALTCLLCSLEKLTQLFAIANKIKVIESGIFSRMTQLKEIYLDENLLVQFPDDLCELETLAVLECSENQLCTLPDNFGNLKHLSTLNLESNKLSSLPDSFSMLRNVKLLSLSNNEIVSLPSNFPSAEILKKLILDKNKLKCVPDWFGDLKSIEELSIDDNELCNEAFTKDFCNSASIITKLSAGRNYLTKLPENIGNLNKLTWLHLGSTMHELERGNFQSGNWLSLIPDSFTELSSLKRLRLDENQITSLPDNFGHLKKLEWLDLGQNQLVCLPESICELQALSYLQLSKNRLKYLPTDIGRLEKLEELRIDSNVLTEIPESISQLQLLHSLDLFNNCLTEFPKAIMSLGNLKRLDVEQNEFPTNNLPKLIKGNIYPERDKSLQDNWRGKTRIDKILWDNSKLPERDEEDRALNPEEGQRFACNEQILIGAMKAGMSLWRHHGGMWFILWSSGLVWVLEICGNWWCHFSGPGKFWEREALQNSNGEVLDFCLGIF